MLVLRFLQLPVPLLFLGKAMLLMMFMMMWWLLLLGILRHFYLDHVTALLQLLVKLWSPLRDRVAHIMLRFMLLVRLLSLTSWGVAKQVVQTLQVHSLRLFGGVDAALRLALRGVRKA